MNFVIGIGALGISVYLLLRILELVLYNIKNILINTTQKKILAVIAADAYIILNIIIVKTVATIDVWTSIVVSLITNSIAIWIAMSLKEQGLRDYVWKYEISIEDDDISTRVLMAFEERHIKYSVFDTWYKQRKFHSIHVYAWDKKGSTIINGILNQFPELTGKYTIIKTGSQRDE